MNTGSTNFSCNNKAIHIDQIKEKSRYVRPRSAIFFSVILLSSALVAYPHQAAFAHESGWHDFCFEETLTFFDFLIDVANSFKWLFGPGIVIVATIIAIGLGIALVNVCPPQLIPPAQATAKAVALECNTFEDVTGDGVPEPGFKAKSVASDPNAPKAVTFLTTGKFTSSVDYDIPLKDGGTDNQDQDLPNIHYVNVLIPFFSIMIPAAVGKALDLVPGLKFLKVFVINLIVGLIFGVFDYKFALARFSDTKDDGSIAHAAFGFKVNDVKFSPALSSFFPLGTNEIVYKAETNRQSDSAPFYFNVIDTIPPEITFENQSIVLEANSHFGFTVDSNSLKELGKVNVFDACAGDAQAKYIGKSFFPLTIILDGDSQLALWQTEDIGYDMYELEPAAIKSALEELSDTQLEEFRNLLELRNLRVDDLDSATTSVAEAYVALFGSGGVVSSVNNAITKKILSDKFDSLRKASLTNKYVTKGIVKVDSLPEKEQIRVLKTLFGKSIADQAADRKVLTQFAEGDSTISKFYKGFKNTEGKTFAKKAFKGEFLDALGGKLFGVALSAGLTAFGEATGGSSYPEIMHQESHLENPGQIIFVNDTIAPDIFIPRNIAIEANTTDANSGCFVNNNTGATECNVTIRAPLVFDIADPFPSLEHNFTADGNFTELESSTLTDDLPLGVTPIAWMATDFSKNVSDRVVLLVNIKEIGTNKISVSFNQTITNAFYDTPIDLTVNATNPDRDPLEFLIEQSPDSGIIESPIDAVFQTKFQKEGTISRLTGLTADPTGLIQDNSTVFFSDAENQRIMKINSTSNMLDLAINVTDVTSRPEGVGLTGSGTFMISDWPNNLILEAQNVGGVGVIKNQFDITGLFEDPKNISVERSSGDIYVTDKQNGTFSKLANFTVFDTPWGIEVTNEVFVADNANHRISHFDSDGIFLDKLGSEIVGNGSNDFDNARDVATDSSSNVYVADRNNNRISKFDSTFNFVGQFGPDNLADPNSVTVSDNEIFVADTGNNRIQKININDGLFNFTDDYNTNSTWIAVPEHGGTVTVNDATANTVSFVLTPSGNTATWQGVNRTITTLPESGWLADFNVTTGMNSGDSNAFVWLVTNDTKHPSNDPGNLDAIAVYLQNNELQIYHEHTGVNNTSSGIPILDDTSYYISLERLNATDVSLGVFDSISRTTHITDSPVVTSIDSGISSLSVLQHTNDFSNGGSAVNLELDNTEITAIFSWLGGCTSGPNCDVASQSSHGFQCTDVTCSGLSSGSDVGQFDNPMGIATNNTHFFVADTDNHRIQIFTATGLHLLSLGTGTAGNANGQFNQTEDVTVGPTGRIIVADTQNDRIQVFDRFGGFGFKTGVQGSGFGEYDKPRGIGIDNLRNIYVSDTGNNRIQKLSPNGIFLDVWKSAIDTRFDGFIERFAVSPLFLFAQAIDLDSNGDVFVGDWTSNGEQRIVKLIRNGSSIIEYDVSPNVTDPKNIAINSTDFIFVTDIQSESIVVFDQDGNFESNISLGLLGIQPQGIAIDENDLVYVSDWDQERIISLDVSGVLPIPIDEFKVDNLFNTPKDLGVDNTFIYVTEVDDPEKIIKIRKDKGVVDQIGFIGPPTAQNALTLGFDSESDIIFFANASNGQISKINSTSGQITPLVNITSTEGIIPDAIAVNPLLAEFGVVFANSSKGDLRAPTGLTFGPNGTLYVASSFTKEIKRYNVTTTEFIDTFVDNKRLEFPRGIIFDDTAENLFVSDSRINKVLRYNGTTGEFIDVFASGGSMQSPKGITFGPDGNLYVSNGANNNILSFNGTDGKRIGQFVKANSNGGLLNPQELAFGPNGDLYVSSFLTDSIKRYNTTGGYIGDFINGTEMSRPTGLTFDPSQESLFVSSFDTNSILKYNATTGEFIGQIAFIDTEHPQGIAIDSEGKLYVSAMGLDEIVRIGIEPVKFFVGDWSTKLIHALDENGTSVTVVADLSTRNGDPKYIAADSVGDIWITFSSGSEGRIENIKGNDGSLLENFTLTNIPLVDLEGMMNLTTGNGTVITFDEDTGQMMDEKQQKTIAIIPEGISLDFNDHIYVSDWQNHRIVELDILGGFENLFKVNSTFSTPMDLAVKLDTDNDLVSLFVADAGTRNITTINSNLLFTEFDPQENVTSLDGITKVDDSLFFTSPPEGKVLELNATGHIIEISDIFVQPEGISVADPDSIYVSDWENQRILEFDSLGQRVGDPIDMSPARFVDKSKLRDIEVKVGPPDAFWVADARTATLPMLMTGDAFDFETAPSVANKFVMGSGIAVDSKENFILASTGNNTLIKFDEAGILLTNRTFSGENILEDVWSSFDETTDSDLFYLAQRSPNIIIQMDANLIEINSTALSFSPTAVATDMQGNIFVSHENNVITKFDDTFTFIQDISVPNGGSISDIAIDSKNNLFVSDYSEHRVHKINATSGSFTGWIGKCDFGTQCNLNQEHSNGFQCTANSAVCDILGDKNGFGISQFFQPTDVAVDKIGNLYVADLQVKPREMNAPRIQKFSNNGFFIENTLSDTSNTRIKGNFNLPKAIASGSSNFFVLDNKTLHVFDVNPFSPISIASITNITSSDITYKANLGFLGNDTFKFLVDDGFDRSKVAIVNLTVNNPDSDADNIFIDVDVDGNPLFSNDFSDVDADGRTEGTIVDRGGQNLVIRDAKNSDKGVFIQADVLSNNLTRAEISACNNSTTIYLNEGNQIHLTCGIPTIEVIRGEVDVSFFDVFGRNGTVNIPIFETLQFEQVDYQLIADSNNEETLNVNLQFNNKSKIYPVPPGEKVKVDTATPDIESVCPNEISLEAEIITGVNRTNTNLGGILNPFLSFTVPVVDNGIPNMTDTTPLLVSHNAPELFPLNETTKVTFTAIDEVGNIDSCSRIVTVSDTTEPDITFPTIPGNLINAITPLHNDAIALHFDTGEARDLPTQLGVVPRPLINGPDKPIICIPSSDYLFPIGRHSVYCQIPDDSAIVGRANFTINVAAGLPVTITNLTASDDSLPVGYSIGDTITVKFSQATNTPPAATKIQIDSLFTIASGPIGANYTGVYKDPSTLVITITDTSVGPPTPGLTTFAINPAAGLGNAAETIDSSALPSPLMDGSFVLIAPPTITAFIADDPEQKLDSTSTDDDTNKMDDIEISVEDTITIRFSEPTNTPGGTGVQNMAGVDTLFSFFPGFSMGDNYKGRWINPSTFVITILKLNTLISNDPSIGITFAAVNPGAGLKNEAGTSGISTAKSPPLIGSFGPFGISKKVSANGTASTVLPSGINVEVSVPEDVIALGITKGDVSASFVSFLGDVIDVTPSDDDACSTGCEISFTFTKNDLKGQNLASLKIYHDENIDGVISLEEELETTIEEILPNVFTANATIFSTSLLGIGSEIISGSGDSGDRTSPKFTTHSVTGNGVLVSCPDDPSSLCQGAVIQDVIQLTNKMPTAKIETGKPVRISMLLYENSGIQGLHHISLYMNLHGLNKAIHQSDTFIRLHQGEQTISDPNGFFESAKVSLIPRGIFIEAVFDVTFSKTMELSDVIFRTWDHKLNVRDGKFLNAIEVIDPQGGNTGDFTIVTGEEFDDQTIAEFIIDKEILNKWAGFSDEIVSDSELLSLLGLEGKNIPPWFKELISEWMIKNEIISEIELVNALTFFYDTGMLN